jgi:superfamily II DNA/RNA helicase
VDSFQGLGLPDFWVARLAAAGVARPTPAQALALPPLLAGRSAVLRAETGSGKTLAYLLPVLEALRARLEAHEPAAQLLPVGLVVAPSAELVAQVCAVACALYPEYANIVLPCHGVLGAVRRRNAGLLVATPAAVAQAINPVHLSALRYVVLDEADALLGGAFRAPLRTSLLQRLKQLMPQDRPAHVFCAATLPAKGSDSAHAFLDKWYPPPETLRLHTAGSHALVAGALQTFWQVDASLPLSALELASQRRRAEAAQALAARELGGSAAAGGALQEGEGEEEEEEEEAQQAGAAPWPEAEEGEEEEEEGEGAAPSLPPRRSGAVDAIARSMDSRKAEDEYLDERVEEERHRAKVFAVTQLAVYEALLLPARRLGLLAAEGGDGSSSSSSSSSSSGAAAAPPAAPLSASAALQDLQEGMAPSRQKAKAKASAAKRDARAFLTIEALQALPLTSSGSSGAPWLQPYTPPQDAAPPALTPATAALVPPTLVFVNSSAAAARLRAALAARCAPHFAVAELSGQVDGAVRLKRLGDFEDGRVRVLVCSDMAARGLDFRGAAHVIQAQFAQAAEGHLHRSGRTARAGMRGMVTSMVTRESLALAEVLARGGSGADAGGSASASASASSDGIERAFSSKQSFTRSRKRREIADAALQLAVGEGGQQQTAAAAAARRALDKV